MNENKKMIPENAENEPLTDEQLDGVAGGDARLMVMPPVYIKCCAANPSHVYSPMEKACPECGSEEFTWIVASQM